MTLRNNIKIALRIIVSAALLSFVFYLAPLDGVANALLHANPVLIVGGAAALLLAHYVSAIKLRYLAIPQKIVASVNLLFRINLAAQFYGFVLPLGAAASSIARWHKLSVINGQRAQAFAAVVLNRVLAFLTVAALGAVAWVFDSHAERSMVFGAMILPILGLFVVIYGMCLSAKLLNFAQSLVDKLGPKLAPVSSRLTKITEAFNCYPRLSVFEHGRLLVISVLHALVGVLALYILCRAVDIEVPLYTLIWVRSALTFLTFVPVSMLGLGVREVSLLYFLHPYGVADTSAVALGLLVLASTLLTTAMGGLVEAHGFVVRWFSEPKRSLAR